MDVRRLSFGWSAIVLVAAGSCLADFQVNTYANRDQYSPSVAMNSLGDSVVVWRSSSSDGRGGGVFGRLFDPNGRPTGDEFQINLTPPSHRVTSVPCAAVRDSGEFIVTWATKDDGSEDGIVARRFDPNAAPLTGELAVNTYTHLAQLEPSIAMNAAGDWVVVWDSWHGTDDHNGKYYITGRLFDCNDMPKGGEFVISQATDSGLPMVAMAPSGDFVVTWVRGGTLNDPPSGSYIKFRRYNADGTPKDNEVQITGDLVGRVEPSISMDSIGNFTIARSSYEGDWDQTDVYAHRFDANGVAIAPEFMVNTCTDGGQLAPSIAMMPDGRSIIVWLSHKQPDGGKDIFGRWYDGDGLPLADEFQINDDTLSEDTYPYPVVAVRADGAFAAVWESYGPDGSRNGVFMKTVDPNQPVH
ncbi:MAG TPA: hypothetical protein PKH24_19565 [Sedimentisphaerales bacterium]|jgi:hypothetical protein|nr:hypothetical protein [Sedimentisphaerales bacterium]HNU31296.1 hypothetical protein [Sedimentisphaerales bacterium]